MNSEHVNERGTDHVPVKPSFAFVNRRVVLCILIAFGVMLGAFLKRCYIAMPWDDWSLMGIPMAYWRKPISVALLIVGVWGVAISCGSLFWWLVSWVTGARWSSGLRRVWENVTNMGVPFWIIVVLAASTMATVLFPWADDFRSGIISEGHSEWFFNTDFFALRQLLYLHLIVILGLVLRRCSLNGDKKSGEGFRTYARRMRTVSAVCLPLIVVAVGMMGIDWIGGLSRGGILSMLPLYFLSYTAVAGLAASSVVAVVCLKYRAGAKTGLEQGHLGALMLAAVIFKAYFLYSMYTITAYGGIPGELAFFEARSQESWLPVAQFVALGGCLFPALLLLIPKVRKTPYCVLGVGIWLLACSLVEAWWLIAPLKGFETGDVMLLQSCFVIVTVGVLLSIVVLLSLICKDRCFSIDSDHVN